MRVATASAALALGRLAGAQLASYTYTRLPLGEILPYPGSWLHNTLQLLADGLFGHEHDFYTSISQATWTGGTVSYSDLNEGPGYWYNGIVPLAYLLNDVRLIGQVTNFTDYVVAHQQSDGWLGPEQPGDSNRYMWGRMMVLLGFTQLMEVDPSYKEPVVDTMYKYIQLQHDLLEQGKGLEDGWGQLRVCEAAYAIEWLLDNARRDDASTQLLLDTIGLLRSRGGDWTAFFASSDFPTESTETFNLWTHGVNLAEALKEPAIFWRYEKNDTDVSEARKRVDMLWKYHGRPTGVFGADEHLAGMDPSRGTETCTVVETMYSFATLFEAWADNSYADMAELAAFNAMPASNMPDWWSHQYLQDLNQPFAKNFDPNPYHSDGGYSSVFGIEPNFPCCTVNHGQGFPKFVTRSWLTTGGNALVHALLSPTIVSTTLPARGNQVTASASTIYPFSGKIDYQISASQSFDLYVRVPAWAQNVTPDPNDPSSQSSIVVNGGDSQALSFDPATSLQKISLPEGNSTVTVTFAMATVVVPFADGSVTVNRGPLNYALGLQYNDVVLATNPDDSRSKEHELDPTSPWAVAIDPSTLTLVDNSGQYTTTTLPNPVWSYPSNPVPVSYTAQACNITWGDIPRPNGQAPAPPTSPAACTSDRFPVTLTPYGATHLRIGQLPVMQT